MTLGKLAWFLPALVGVVTGCARARPQADDYAERCSNGERMACARACELGVHGKAGCMAGVHEQNPVRRTKMLSVACKARQAGACLMAAEASITLNLSNPLEYQTLLSSACDQADKQGCEKLGDFWLSDSLTSAKAAYDKGCRLEPSRTEACTNEVTERIAAIDRELAACKKEELAACENLLRLSARRNHDLGYQGAEAACRIRGLDQHYRDTKIRHPYKLRKRFSNYQACGLFMLARAAAEPGQSVEFQRVPLPEPSPRANQPLRGRVTLADLAFHFRDAPSAQPERVTEFKAGVAARIQERLALAARCYDRHLGGHPGTRGALNATFIIDKLGEPLELRPSSDLADLELCACLLSAAIPARFTGMDADLGSIARVEARFELTPTDAGKR